MKETLEQIKQNPVFFLKIDEKLRYDKNFVKECVYIDSRIIFYLDKKFLNREFFEELYKINKNIVKFTRIDSDIDDLIEYVIKLNQKIEKDREKEREIQLQIEKEKEYEKRIKAYITYETDEQY